MAVYLAKRALPRYMEEPPPDVSEDLARLPSAFGQQWLGSATGSLNIKKLNHPDGAWRLRSGDWRSLFFQTGEDFLVAAIGPRGTSTSDSRRSAWRVGPGGIRILETETRDVASEEDAKRDPTFRQARRPKPVENNGFSPFDDAMLRSIAGVDDDILAFLRSLPPTVDAPTVIAQRLANTDLAFLLADLWERPAASPRHVCAWAPSRRSTRWRSRTRSCARASSRQPARPSSWRSRPPARSARSSTDRSRNG